MVHQAREELAYVALTTTGRDVRKLFSGFTQPKKWL